MTQNDSQRDSLRQLLALVAISMLAVSATAGAAISAGAAASQDNSVEFDGEISLEGDPATDSSTFSYDLVNSSAASDFTATFEGVTATQDESASGMFVGSNSTTFDVAGTLSPGGPAGGSPQVSLSLSDEYVDETTRTRTVPAESSRTITTEIPAEATITGVEFVVANGAGSFQSHHNMEFVVEGQTVHSIGNYNDYSDGDRVVVENLSISPTDGTVTIDHHLDNGMGAGSYDMGHKEIVLRTDADTSSATVVSNGEPTTVDNGSSAPLGLQTGSNTFSTETNAWADWSLDWTERSPTTDPSIEVNGHTVSHSGTLAAGETATLNVSTSWLEDGSNDVSVSTGSAGGIQTVVGLDYSHSASVSQSTSYEGEAWSERYNVTRSFGTDQQDVELSVPFSSKRVVAIRDVEVRSDGGSWEPLADSATSYDGTTLTAEIGNVSAGEQVSVRATGSKVDVENGEIEVIDPTVEGNDLSTRFRVADDAGNESVEIAVGATVDWTRLHYLESSSWSASESSRMTTSNQILRLPNAPSGGEATVATAPLAISPETGDVVATVDNPSEPRFSLSPGQNAGDVVSIRYFNATSGEEYALVDESADRIVDRGTANSPVLLETNDEDSIYTITLASGGGGGGPAVQAGPVAPVSGSSGLPVLLLVVSVGGVMGSWIVSRKFGAGRMSKWLVATVGLVSTFIVAEFATPASVVGTLSGDLLHGSGQSVMSVVVGSVILVAVILLNRRLDRRLPTPIIGLIAAGVGFWMVSSIAPTFLDSLSASLEEIGPLFWVALLGGGGWLAYRYVKARRSPDTRVTLSLGGNQ